MQIIEGSKKCWKLGIAAFLAINSLFVNTSDKNALAQLIPDQTLGDSQSIVTPQGLRDLIEGGARRDTNLFHSFLEFNVNEGQQVYFHNPDGVINILTRVTGSNISHILGKLGVDGYANLFLLNPNGFVFGENAILDIKGSFIPSTADAIQLGDGFFHASNPYSSNLLSVEPGALFFNQVANQGTITNQGNLAAGQNLTLAAHNLNLKGQLHAGGNLTLQALDTVKIRDTIGQKFLATAGGNLLIQGNQSVDIFALNHPESGFFSGGDTVLRSGNTVSSDAHFTSGGDFRIEQLDGSLGNWFSIFDPVIRANGDVALNSYTGASLHILAGGSVKIPGTVKITTTETANNAIAENITLSDGTTISIDGSKEPTLDIRAGIKSEILTGNSITGTVASLPNFSNATSAEINIGEITVTGGGTVFLSNQYQPNLSLDSGNGIQVGEINTFDELGGGSIFIDSRSGITLNGSINASATSESEINISGTFSASETSGNGGDITLLAQDDIIIPNVTIYSNGLLGGSINLNSKASILIFMNFFEFIGSITADSGTGGNINLTAESISIDGNGFGGVFTQIAENAEGKGGDINVKTGSLVFTNLGVLITETYGQGDTGNINIEADSISFADTRGFISSDVFGDGNGGDINIKTNSLSLLNGSQVRGITLGSGQAGNVMIMANSISLDGVNNNGFISGIVSQAGRKSTSAPGDAGVGTSAEGDAGEVKITTNSLSLTNGAQIRTSTLGQANAGTINITADSINIDGFDQRVDSEGIPTAIFSEVRTNAEGQGGNIKITTG
ncbi:MAG: filamentous hemagglutinin N-terminal domain-containing protein, partial [Moorea sp. SIO2B7]|nr:filamentous hemagglutinin N-terminal domain-containing protein [Moorena sp. SIO2B7]